MSNNTEQSKEKYTQKILSVGKELTVLLRAFFMKTPASGITDWKNVFYLAVNQRIAAFLYQTAKISGCPTDVLTEWEGHKNKVLRKNILFQAERNFVCEELKKQGVESVVIKGEEIACLYPEPLLREMSDIDVYFQDKHTKILRAYMKARGYKLMGKVALHDEFHKEPIYNFEWHRLLIFDDTKAGKYLVKAWDRTEVLPNGERRLSKMDAYVYFLAHFKKHMKPGVSLRPYVDFYLYRKALLSEENFFNDSLNELLKKIELDEAEKELTAVCSALFEDGAPISDERFYLLLTNGPVGTRNKKIHDEIERGGVKKYYLKRLFPSYSKMRFDFPILRKCPPLLPFLYVWRFMLLVFSTKKRKNLRTELNQIKNNKE